MFRTPTGMAAGLRTATGSRAAGAEALLSKFSGDPLGSRTHGWRSALEGSPHGAADFDSALRVLGQLTDLMPSHRQVIHGDLLYSNVLVQGDRVSAVLDWGNSMYGDHLFDAAWLLYCQPRYTQRGRRLIYGALQRHWEQSGPIPDDLDIRLLCYQIHIGLDAQLYTQPSRNAGRARTESRSDDGSGRRRAGNAERWWVVGVKPWLPGDHGAPTSSQRIMEW